MPSTMNVASIDIGASVMKTNVIHGGASIFARDVPFGGNNYTDAIAQRFGRGLVLIDPPYEAQLDEFDHALAALRDALMRWPQATYAMWYPIKQRRTLRPFQREAARLPAKSVLVAELLVHPDDSPLRMNGSALLLLESDIRVRCGVI